MDAQASERGRCGTCRHFTDAPDWGRYMGECAQGWRHHTPWAPLGERNAPPLPVMHAAARCMCDGQSRWALRAGLTLGEPSGSQA